MPAGPTLTAPPLRSSRQVVPRSPGFVCTSFDDWSRGPRLRTPPARDAHGVRDASRICVAGIAMAPAMLIPSTLAAAELPLGNPLARMDLQRAVPILQRTCKIWGDFAARRLSLAKNGAVTGAPHDQPFDPPAEQTQLPPWERSTNDDNGRASPQTEAEAHDGWCEKWAPPCPEGSPQRLRRSLGFRERNIGELELRVPLGGDDRGVCQVIVDERDDEVYVRVLACCHDDDEDASREREYLDCPVRVWLERALGGRAVVDVDTDEELPLFTPRWVNNVPQADHGYRSAHRRRRAQKRP